MKQKLHLAKVWLIPLQNRHPEPFLLLSLIIANLIHCDAKLSDLENHCSNPLTIEDLQSYIKSCLLFQIHILLVKLKSGTIEAESLYKKILALKNDRPTRSIMPPGNDPFHELYCKICDFEISWKEIAQISEHDIDSEEQLLIHTANSLATANQNCSRKIEQTLCAFHRQVLESRRNKIRRAHELLLQNNQISSARLLPLSERDK